MVSDIYACVVLLTEFGDCIVIAGKIVATRYQCALFRYSRDSSFWCVSLRGLPVLGLEANKSGYNLWFGSPVDKEC